MPGPRFEVDEKESRKVGKEKKPRRVAVKNPSFFLFKRISENGDLSPIGSYETESEARDAYGKSLDGGIPQDGIRGFKGRILSFEVKETKRRITVR